MADIKLKVPNLRFKGFTDYWEQRKLGEVTTSLKSYSLTRKYETIDTTGYKYIHYGDIHTGKAKKIDNPDKLPSIIKGNYFTLDNGDIVVADASEDYQGIADAAILLNKNMFSIVAGLHTIAFRPNNKLLSSLFAYYTLQTSNFKHYGYRVGTGLKVFGISNAAFFNYSSFYPTFMEQQIISKLLNLVERLITLQQRKLELLKQLKKGFLQKMFAEKNNKQPVLRFKGFHDDWEQRKLGEIVEWSKGSGLSKDALNIQGIGVPVIHYADLYKFNSVQKEVIHWTMNDIGTKIPENNLLFPMSDVTPDGLARTSTVLQSNVKAGGDVLIAKLNKDILSTFMSYQINRNKNQILPLVTGTTVRHINSKSLSTLKVTVPGKNEQKYVGSILMRFDSLIALHQRKQNHLKLLKKSLLQQMFM